MSAVNYWECPNCGSTDFVEVTPRQHRCAYCGTVLTLPEAGPELVTCPHCGFDNERGDRYCNNCGRTLVSWAEPAERAKRVKRDPAVTSIIVTVVGSFFLPIVGAILGLVLAYKALREARAGGWGSEKTARTAVIVGWGGIALGLLPLCMAMTTSGTQLGYSLCNNLLQMVSDVLGKR